MQNRKSRGNPTNALSDKEVAVEHLNDEQKSRYRSIVESMIYLAAQTRPDIPVAGSSLRSPVENRTIKRYVAVDRVLQCLNGTRDLTLNLKLGESKQ